MALSLDIIALGVPRLAAARDFYATAFAAPVADDDQSVRLRLHGAGRLTLHPIDELAAEVAVDPATSGFRGYVLSVAVESPAEVEALLGTAAAQGATVVKQAKKEFFGEFTAVHRAPDGAVWKLAASSKRNPDPVPDPPRPTETAVILGVASPKASTVFYEALGMSADHDYGDKFIDFTIAEGVCRLGLLPRKPLAKDAGVSEAGDGFAALVLTHLAASPTEVDRLLAAAAAAGGRVTAPARRTDDGAYVGLFADPDGHHWKVVASV
ncbi:putative glyoxalase superfamily protein PhnB [Actinoalloteichus hoggarensis]|uniref:Glyoxalase-like domain protein n=1 Tax=Actinoalloteichus hoggarensis TaxID=1470176 RepID=A0A221W402_9PSEU|nr:VOC family protein [Actinoalloteichus hoggarensis]ASO20484.1 Glyoxalase-like domain protein [Actinoalloteichus hoggarensis]MBB5923524.1 putative glyoxalase superfamily protein PhnB [Actinoalloteichus hoggarensis]